MKKAEIIKNGNTNLERIEVPDKTNKKIEFKNLDKITHKELVETGFELKGQNEDDPYYYLQIIPPSPLSISSLAGVLVKGEFWLYGIHHKKYRDINEIKILINALGIGQKIINFVKQ